MSFSNVPNNIQFPALEEETLNLWKQHNVFARSVQQRPADKPYSFYDGPPFATGLPHYGHLLASIIKDIIPRYQTMRGYRVERKFGWDCHGLPVEYEIDKTLGISGAAGVEEFGIANYNAECRKIVQRFSGEWEKTIGRIGRWVDFENGYKTMDLNFMESVWWVFKQLWDKGLVYQGFRVMPYSTAVATPLSNFEAGSNYKDVQDPAVTVRFPVDGMDNTCFIAWTTTPWTLPSNLALTVGPELDYVKVLEKSSGFYFILGAERVAAYWKKPDAYEIVEQFKGSDLVGKTYEPLFPYFADHKNAGAFRVIGADFVTDGDGTGIVHTAPAFGEDDYAACFAEKIELVQPVDPDGKFTSEVTDFAGMHVKEADKEIIAWLKDSKKLVRHDTINHSYPFCWRSDTPLIYRAITSWFIDIEPIKEKMLAANADTHWVPENLRDGRFGKWLEGARDWNVSRNRFWGNPMPIWVNDQTSERVCIGSIEQLSALCGETITDLHRESIDDLTWESPDGGTFRRVSEVFDCWFESGSMPYAQAHYPFENKESFEGSFPADFIAEGLDQTRGWFYTLTVLGTALFGHSPFKNVIVNGMLLAEDGKKMSKRLQNYPDPTEVINTHGADALRLYMIQSPAVRAEELRFSENGVKEIVRRIMLKWWNSYSFFISYAAVDQWEPTDLSVPQSDNILDQWIVSRMQSLLNHTEKEMDQYHLYSVVPGLIDFIEELTNIYIRLNRKRFWTEGESADKTAAYRTLYYVLFSMTKIMAPFTPFLADTMYQNLKLGFGTDSVHLEDYPIADTALIRSDLEDAVSIMNRIMVMGRNLREQQNVKVKIPLKRLAIIHRSQATLDHVRQLDSYLREELNVRDIAYITEEDTYVELSAKANGRTLGKRLGKKFGAVGKAVQQLGSTDIVTLERGGTIEIEGETLGGDDVMIYRKAKDGFDNVVSDAFITIELDTTVEHDQQLEGLAREVVGRIQKLRKTADLQLDDRITVQFAADNILAEAITAHQDYIQEQTLATALTAAPTPSGQACDDSAIDDHALVIALSA